MSAFITCLADDSILSEHYNRQLEEIIDQLLEEYDLIGGEVGVIIADDQYLRSLNQKFRAKDTPTDVLSFCFLESVNETVEHEKDYEGGEFAVGDIYISAERAREQAKQARHSVEKEVLLLAVHGMLHLLGFDHDHHADARLMHHKEKKLLQRIDQNEPGEE